ncbi:MAG: TIGR02302 family protein [Shimia sp.]
MSPTPHADFDAGPHPGTLPRTTRKALARTRRALVAERAVAAFWPAIAIAAAALGAVMLGIHDRLGYGAWLGLAGAGAIALVGALIWGLRRFRWPSRPEAAARLDATMPGRPLRTLADTLAIGSADPAAQGVWAAHLERMRARAATARAPRADLRTSRADPYALRYAAVLLLAVGLLFGSVLRVGEAARIGPGSAQAALGPAWEGWVEPPRYTGLPTIYLPDVTDPTLAVPEGAQVTLRLYGTEEDLTVAETLSGGAGSQDRLQVIDVAQPGRLAIDGRGGRAWDIAITPDAAPDIDYAITLGERDDEVAALFRQSFRASDDYGVESAMARFQLDLERVERAYGLAVAPDPRPDLTVDLPVTIAGDRTAFTETAEEDFSRHPWANLPVVLQLEARDARDQLGLSTAREIVLPGRRFFDPLAKAVIEQRRDYLWARANDARVAQVLRAVSYRPQDVFRTEVAALRLRRIIERIETYARFPTDDELRAEVAEDLWALAVQLEEGDLADAAERLRRAQERLQEAIENGATDEEIAELMQELREAMQDYMRQLAESQPEGQQSRPQDGEGQEMSGDQLQEMLDRLQQLMEEGRMEEAQELLEQIQRMMENMQVTQGQQGGEGQQSEGQQAMEGLADTLREQQGLSDEAFEDLQEQFGQQQPGQQGQQQPGQQGQQQPGQRGQGQQPGQPGQEGQPQPGQGREGQQQARPGEGQEGTSPGSLADRQEALRRELERQGRNLPGAGTEEGDAARDALGRAGEAMDRAEDALRNDDLAEAIDEQSNAMEALRDGMRALGEAMQREQRQGQGQETRQGEANPAQRDPLGRDATGRGNVGTEEQMLDGEDPRQRARELLDEIRRRSAEAGRSEAERDYLNRLLDRF